jgi:hypothetical protein
MIELYAAKIKEKLAFVLNLQRRCPSSGAIGFDPEWPANSQTSNHQRRPFPRDAGPGGGGVFVEQFGEFLHHGAA